MRIGVWNVAFLGDTLLTLPLLQVLRVAYPQATIDFWVRKGYVSLYQEQAGYSTYGYERAKGLSYLYHLGKHISSIGYDIWINPHPSYRSSYIMSASRAEYKLSYTIPSINTLLATHSISRNPSLHEVERLLSLLIPLDINTTYTLPCYTVPDYVKEDVRVQYNPDTKQRIALAVGAMWKTKRWPAEYFADIVSRAQRAGYAVYLLGGGKEEEAIAQKICELCGVQHGDGVYSCINAPLHITAGILEQSTLCCGNDTGLMHLAWILNIPTLALYGPTAPEQGFTPLSKGSYSLGKELRCRPCGKHGSHVCKEKHFKCMYELTPDMVWEHIERMMKIAVI